MALVLMVPRPVEFQSTLPVGGATIQDIVLSLMLRISIHAPRGGSDGASAVVRLCTAYFNPRSPWGERLSNKR